MVDHDDDDSRDVMVDHADDDYSHYLAAKQLSSG